MSRQMDITAEDILRPVGDRMENNAGIRPPSAEQEAKAHQRAQAAMACYESYIAEYRTWARSLRRPNS